MKKHLLLCTMLISLALCTSCKGQNKPEQPVVSVQTNLKVVDTTNSPKRITRTIIQDKKGTIWFATWEGMIQFDGSSFTNLTRSVSPSRFFSVIEDRKGNFWFASIGSGVYYYNGKSFQNFTTEDGLASNRVTHIYEDKKGGIWFGTEGGASYYDGKIWKTYTTKDGLPQNSVNAIIEDKTGRLWFGTTGDACFYDGKTFTKISGINEMSFKNVRHIIEDKKGAIWLGGNDGLWRYSNDEFVNFSKRFVGYIYEDSKGNIWTSSESIVVQGWSLSRYDNPTSSKENTRVTEVKTGEGMFFGILEDTEGHIWVGNLNGVYRYNGTSFEDFK